MDATLLASIAGIVLSLAFSYIPGLDTWYAVRDGTVKRLIMLGVLLLTALATFGLSCAKLWPTVTCDQAGAMKLVEALIFAAITNQSAYLLSPRTQRVGQAIADQYIKDWDQIEDQSVG